MLRDELKRILTWSERHRRLIARLLLAVVLSIVVDLVGALLMWQFERSAGQTEIHGFGEAVFFSTVQILTVSSQLKNPVTTAGRFVDVFLEIWALFVVTAVAGSFASFFSSADPD